MCCSVCSVKVCRGVCWKETSLANSETETELKEAFLDPAETRRGCASGVLFPHDTRLCVLLVHNFKPTDLAEGNNGRKNEYNHLIVEFRQLWSKSLHGGLLDSFLARDYLEVRPRWCSSEQEWRF